MRSSSTWLNSAVRCSTRLSKCPVSSIFSNKMRRLRAAIIAPNSPTSKRPHHSNCQKNRMGSKWLEKKRLHISPAPNTVQPAKVQRFSQPVLFTPRAAKKTMQQNVVR